MTWQSIIILFCLFVVLPLSVYRGRKARKSFCSCEGCQNNESGWLSNEYKNKYPNCKLK